MSYLLQHPMCCAKKLLARLARPVLSLCACLLLAGSMLAPLSLTRCSTLALASNSPAHQEASQTQNQIYPQVEDYLAQHLDAALLHDKATDDASHTSSPLFDLPKLFSLGMKQIRSLGASPPTHALEDSGHTMTVKYTLADTTTLPKDTTLDSVWDNPETALATIVGQYESMVHLFNASDDYYVAFIDATKLTHDGVIYDTVFAADDTSGTLIQGIIYDKTTGIAYIPKSLFINKDGQKIAFGIQAQLLVGVKLSDALQTQFQAHITSKRADLTPLATTQVITVDSLDNTVTIPLLPKQQASKISLADIAVYTGSSSKPYKLSAHDGAFYDKDTGKLTLALSPFAQPSITIQITSKTAIEALMDTFAPATPAYGFARISNPDEMAMWPWGKFDSIDLSKVHVGDAFEFTTTISYDDTYFRAFAAQCAPYIYAWKNNTVGYKGEESTEVLIDKLLSGATWNDMGKQLAKLSEADGHAIKLVDDVAFALSLPWGHSKSSAWDFSGLHANDPHTSAAKGSGVLPMLCGHVKQPKNVVKSGTHAECTAMLRVLAKKETGDTPYVVLGFVSPQVTTQSGVAIVKFGVLQPKIQTNLTEDISHSHTIASSDVQESSDTTTPTASKDSPTTSASTALTLTDQVSYSGLITGASYSLKACLVDAHTGQTLDNSFGTVACEEKLVPKEASGKIDVHFSIDKPNELPSQIVSYVSLFDAQGQEIVKHHDVKNAQQTVWRPAIVTHALCDSTKEQMLGLNTTQHLTDKTELDGLIPGTTYLLKSELVDVGEDYRSTLAEQTYEFTAQDTKLSHDATFELDRQSVYGQKLVAQTKLYEGKRCIATHARLDNTQQTIMVPAIKTKLSNKQTSDKTLADFPLQLIDTVSYSGLIPGKQYRIIGTLMNKQTQEPLALDDTQLPLSEVAFTPEEPSGVIEVPFLIHNQPQTSLDIVAFEKLYLDETELANHEDFEDQEQSFSIPKPPTPPQPTTPPERLQHKGIKLPKTGDLLSMGFIICLAAGGWFAVSGSKHFKHQG